MTGYGSKQTTLGAIAEFVNGGAWNQTEYSDGGVPVVRVTDVKDETVDLSECKFLPKSSLEKYAKHLLRTGDLVICTVGSHPTQPGSVVGRAVIIPDAANGALLNQNAVCIRSLSPSLDQSWLGYLGRSREFHDYIISCARGSANQVRMAIGLLKEMPVEVPLVLVQQRIANILSAYDELIENNQRRIRILEDMARSLYREWFVHFRYPGHESVPLVDSPLGPIPQGWEVKRLGGIADIKWGDTSTTKSSYMEEGYDAYSASGLDGKMDHYDFDRTGIVLSAIGAQCGKTWLARRKWSCIKNTIRLWSKVECISTEFLFVATEGQKFWPRRGAAQPFISQGDAERIELLISDRVTMKRFTTFAANGFEQISMLQTQIQNLRRTRDLLLPRLLSGQVALAAL